MNTKFEKICPFCKIQKNYVEFYNDRRSKTGKSPYCKICTVKKRADDRAIKHELGLIKKGRPRMSVETKTKILEYYNSGIGSHRIGKMIGYSKKAVLNFLQKNVIMRHESYRKYKFKNENYFDIIDTPEKAYYMGFLWADGCNFRKDVNGKNAYHIVMNLQERDGDILRRLCKEIYETDDILRLTDPNTTNHKHPQKRQKQYNLRITSKHISDTLLNYGMEPRKSFTLTVPKNVEFDENLWRAFIRGYYDGDGGISFNNNSKNYVVGMLSSPDFIFAIKDIIYKYTGIDIHEEKISRYSKPMYSLKIHGNNKSKAFLDWLYVESTVHLVRKYDKYMSLKQLVENRLNNNPTR